MEYFPRFKDMIWADVFVIGAFCALFLAAVLVKRYWHDEYCPCEKCVKWRVDERTKSILESVKRNAEQREMLARLKDHER